MFSVENYSGGDGIWVLSPWMRRLSTKFQLIGESEMRALMILGLSIILLAAPSSSYADGNVVDTVTTTVKENPGKSTGVAACAAIIIFPPAAIWCAATLVGAQPTTATCKNW